MSQYGKLCTIIYDLDKPPADEAETRIYTRYVKSKADPILEPMCGSGRFLIPLLRAGFNISGFDLSENMLAACRRRCTGLGLTPRVFQADVTRFEPSERYRCVFIPCGSLSLLVSGSDLRLAVANIGRCLSPGGVFVLSFLGPDAPAEEIPVWKETMNYPLGDRRIVCLQKSVFRRQAGVLDIRLRYEIRRGAEVVEAEDQDFPLRLREDDLVVDALQRAGFSEIEKVPGLPPRSRFHIMKCVKTRGGSGGRTP